MLIQSLWFLQKWHLVKVDQSQSSFSSPAFFFFRRKKLYGTHSENTNNGHATPLNPHITSTLECFRP